MGTLDRRRVGQDRRTPREACRLPPELLRDCARRGREADQGFRGQMRPQSVGPVTGTRIRSQTMRMTTLYAALAGAFLLGTAALAPAATDTSQPAGSSITNPIKN